MNNERSREIRTTEEAYEIVVQMVEDNLESLEHFKERGGLAMLRDGSHILALVDPQDPVGQAALKAFGLDRQGRQFMEEFQSTVLDVARRHASAHVRTAAAKALACTEVKLAPVLAAVPRHVLPEPVNASLETPGPVGSVPILVVTAGMFALATWDPDDQGVEPS